jgi:malate synthase
MSPDNALDVPKNVQIVGEVEPEYAEILTFQALELAASLHRRLNPQRKELLKRRNAIQSTLDTGHDPDFLEETAGIRNDPGWRVTSTPPDLMKRHVEITGPTDRKMMINALNSGANVFMADFEDANSPTWSNMIEGQINLRDAVRGEIAYSSPDGKLYTLNEQIATLMVRPRGWHLVEKHVLVDGEPISASLFDFSLYFFHNAHKLLAKGSGPYFYLPKLENHLEARLWNEAFLFAQRAIGLPAGTIRATVLIETILAAFEMEEILYELREHSAGLNAGRWDYIFSVIKKFRNRPDFLLPDRSQITMAVPFMRAYTELLVKTCHKRGAHAMGGMAAYIPSRKDPEVNERALGKVREDKHRESKDGFDGTWVAHPDLVPVALQIFQNTLGEKAHQKEQLREDVQVKPKDLLDFRISGGSVSEAGLRQNISVAVQYLESWLRGTGAAAIDNLMEDTATAEISRAQVWQWLHHAGTCLADGRPVTLELFHGLMPEEVDKIKDLYGEDLFQQGKFELARGLFDELATDPHFIDFLTLKAYDRL